DRPSIQSDTRVLDIDRIAKLAVNNSQGRSLSDIDETRECTSRNCGHTLFAEVQPFHTATADHDSARINVEEIADRSTRDQNIALFISRHTSERSPRNLCRTSAEVQSIGRPPLHVDPASRLQIHGAGLSIEKVEGASGGNINVYASGAG